MTSLVIEELRTLVLVHQLGDIGRAAGRLGRPYRTVSFQIQRLERTVGVPVYHRRRGGFALTEAGQTLVDYALRMLELDDAVVDALAAARLAGTIRLGVAADLVARARDVVTAFTRRHPEAHALVTVGSNRGLADDLLAARLDLALVFAEQASAIEATPVPLAWWGAAAADPGSGPGSDTVRLVVMVEPCPFRQIALFTLEQAQVPYRIVHEATGLEALWQAVAAHGGVTVRCQPTPRGAVPVAALPPPPPIWLGLALAPSAGFLARRMAEQLRAAFELAA
ncbi:MAG: LysR family transcriptional regulator [Alphaproteobacteria bacterium]|nr:LysR family transcriptional regulator [Alphaproteobacteria bacterium]